MVASEEGSVGFGAKKSAALERGKNTVELFEQNGVLVGLNIAESVGTWKMGVPPLLVGVAEFGTVQNAVHGGGEYCKF